MYHLVSSLTNFDQCMVLKLLPESWYSPCSSSPEISTIPPCEWLIYSPYSLVTGNQWSAFYHYSVASSGITYILYIYIWASLVAQLVKSLPAMLETWVWSLGWEDTLEKESYPLQYSGLENSMDCIVHGVAKSWTRLSDYMCIYIYIYIYIYMEA